MTAYVERKAAAERQARKALGEIDPLESLADALVPEMGKVIDELADRLEFELSDEAWRRVLARGLHGVSYGLGFVADGMAIEMVEPAPIPFDPPGAGSWLRERRLPRLAKGRLRARPEPEWRGSWHLFTGDLIRGDPRSQTIRARVGCGHTLTLREISIFADEPWSDVVVAPDMPGVDACRRCQRAQREGVTA